MDDIPMQKMPWWQGMIARFFPKLFFRWHARKMGIQDIVFDRAHDLFTRVQRIDIIPTGAGTRGFILVLDRKTALYFYQDGDHFKYDGFEMGEYDEGDVTLFDHLKEVT